MKKKLGLFLAFIVICFCVLNNKEEIISIVYKNLNYTTYTESDFDDINFFHCLYDSYKGSKQTSYDGKVLTKSNLNGISTTKEFCRDRGITSIDGSGLKELTKLVALDLSNTDDDISNNNSISSIDTSNLTALETLNLSGVGLSVYNANNNSKAITTLNLSNNKLGATGYVSRESDSNLSTLTLNNNNGASARLTVLDLTKDTKIKNIIINDNPYISSILFPSEMTHEDGFNINISNNPRLKNITLPNTISTAETTTSTIQIKNNGATLTDENTVITMPQSIESETTLEISGNLNLKELTLPKTYSSNPKLGIIIVANSIIINNNDNLTSIDASIMSGSKEIKISENNKLSSLIFGETIYSDKLVIENNSSESILNLTLPSAFENATKDAEEEKIYFDIIGNKINSIDLPSFPYVGFTGENKGILELNISDNSEIRKIYSTRNGIDKNTNIKLNNNSFTGEEKEIIMPYLGNQVSIQVKNNNFEKLDFEVRKDTHYITDDCSYATSGSETSSSGTSGSESTGSIPISPPISSPVEESCKKPIEVITKTVIKELTISGNSNLNTIDIENLSLPVGITSSIIINDSKNVTSLVLPSPSLYSPEDNTTSVMVDLKNNGLTNLQNIDSYIVELNVANNKLKELDLSSNARLTKLYASDNLFTKIILPSTSVLEYADLKNNMLTLQGLQNLSKNTAIRELNLSNNKFRSVCLNQENKNGYLDGVCPDDATETTIDLSTLSKMTKFTLDNNKDDLKTIILPDAAILSDLNINSNEELVSIKKLQNASSKMANLVITGNKKLLSISIPSGATSATADLSDNGIKEVTINRASSSSGNKFIKLDLSSNNIDTINNLSYCTALKELDLHNNNLDNLVINNSALTSLNIGETNNFKYQITAYAGNEISISKKYPITITSPSGKSVSIIEGSIKTDDLDLNINGNSVSSTKVGDYTITTDYAHTIGSSNNTFKVRGDVHIVSIEENNDRYEVIDDGSRRYIYIRNFDSVEDSSGNIPNNLKINGTSKYAKINSASGTNPKIVTVQEVGGDASQLASFVVVGLKSTNTDKYIITENGILVLDSTFSATNVTLDGTTSGLTKSLNEDNTELIIKHGDIVVKTIPVVYLTSVEYKDYLTKEYIYDNTIDTTNISKITLSNGTTSITYKDNCGDEQVKCEVLNINNKEGKLIKKYDIVKMTSDIYEITNDYVLSLNNEFNISNINSRSALMSLSDDENQIILKYGNEVVDTLDIGVVIANKYDLTKDYVIGLKEDYDDIGFMYSDLFDCYKKALCELNDDGSKIVVILNNQQVKSFTLEKISSLNIGTNFQLMKNDTKKLLVTANNNSKYLISKNIIYTSSDPNIVSISEDGTVKGVSTGTATITATTTDVQENNRVVSNSIEITVIDSVKVTYISDNKVIDYVVSLPGDQIDLKKLTKDGYTLIGYSYNEEVYSIENKYTVPQTDIELVAVWKPNSYQLTVELNGGSSSEDANGTYEYNSMINLVEPTKEGYTFTGWKVKEGNGVINNNVLTMGSEATIVEALWKINSYVLTIELNGGTSTQELNGTYEYNSIVDLVVPSRNGYLFTGWEIKEGNGVISGNTVTIGTQNIVIRATWIIDGYILNVDLNGGTSTQKFDSRYEHNATIDLVSPTKKGYTFTGWEVTEGNGVISGNILTIGDETTTIKATWRINNYQLTVDLKGGTTTQRFNASYDYNSTVKLDVPTREGYIFVNWDVVGGTIENNILTIDASNVTITAKWKSEEYVVTYYYDGGSAKEVNKTVKYDEAYGTLPTPVKKGYIFVGWYANLQLSDLITSSSIVTNAKNHILYAKYEAVIDKVESSKYTIDNNKIIGISPSNKTDIDFGFGSDFTTKLYNASNQVKTGGYVATGDIVKISKDNYEVGSYSIIIKGDVVGNGMITVADVAKLYQYQTGKIKMESVFIEAGNVVSTDNVIKINDVAKLYQYVKGKIKEL